MFDRADRFMGKSEDNICHDRTSIRKRFFWAVAPFGALAVLVFLKQMQTHISESRHLKAIRIFAFCFAPIWAALLLCNVFLLWRVAEVIYQKLDADPELLRWYVLAFVGLTTTLGGILGSPIALVRVFMTERQTKTAEESFITEQINKAVEGLGANRLDKQIGRNVSFSRYGRTVRFLEWHDHKWQSPPGIDMATEDVKLESEPWREFENSVPNIEVRIGALGSLARIFRLSHQDRSRILTILTAYICENSPAKAAERAAPIWVPSEELGFSNKDNTALWHWTRQLRTRVDISMALANLANLQSAYPAENNYATSVSRPWKRSLSDTALQALGCAGLDLSGIRFQRAHLQGTDFKDTNLQNSIFTDARMTYTRLSGADLRKANCSKAILKGGIFSSSKMQGCDLSGADVQGALFEETQFDAASNLRVASNRGSALRSLDLNGIYVPREFIVDAFGDATVKGLPVNMNAGEGELAHWAEERLDRPEFHHSWREWQKSIERVPDGLASAI